MRRATVSVPELASLLGVSAWTLYQAVRDGQSPVTPIVCRRRILFSRQAVEALVGPLEDDR